MIFVCWVMLSTRAQAEMFYFKSITNNTAADAAAGEAQLSVEVSDPGDGKVLFTLKNDVGEASSITDVYFDDGTLLGVSSFVGSSGVSFSQPAAPPDLSGGNGIVPKFDVTSNWSFDADSSGGGVYSNGVNTTAEYLNIYYTLETGKTVADVINAINIGNRPDLYYDPITELWDYDDVLRIGLHVQGFDGGGSESFVTTPIPTSVIIGLLGMGVAGIKLRKFA